ncbi:MAG: universal stress protein, UspA [Planctomyces sp.]|nr:universal stress protein, UspA [Planctomyces sp.]
MKRFKNILLIYECGRATLDRAAALAKNNRARLTVVQVVRDMPKQWRQMDLGGTALDLQELAVKEYQSRLKEFVAALRQDGIRVSTKVLIGTPFLEVIREVIANKRDLVIMTAEGKGGLKERLFGSTSLHLMRKCPCPVLVMKPTRTKRFPRILAAVDPDPEDKTRDSLNATILQLASSLAAHDKAELHVIHAWTLMYESLMRGHGGFVESEIRSYAYDEELRHRKSLDSLLAEHTDGAARVHLIEGDADKVIPQFTKAQNIDLLVMGTVCRLGIPGFFIGNTAEKILDEVDCSVLTVKPEGFVSPVELA